MKPHYQWEYLKLQCKYRTPHGWDNKEYKVILVDQMDNGPFILTGFNKETDIDIGRVAFGVTDVLEFELFEDEDA